MQEIPQASKTIRCEESFIHEDQVVVAQEQLIDGLTATHLARTFQALSDPTRVRLISALTRAELCVCDLVDALQVAQPLLSFHLKTLKQAGLVLDRRFEEHDTGPHHAESPERLVRVRAALEDSGLARRCVRIDDFVTEELQGIAHLRRGLAPQRSTRPVEMFVQLAVGDKVNPERALTLGVHALAHVNGVIEVQKRILQGARRVRQDLEGGFDGSRCRHVHASQPEGIERVARAAGLEEI